MGIDFIQLSIGSESICLHSPNQQSVANIRRKPSNSLINQTLRNPSYSWSYVGSTSDVTKRKSHMLRKPNFTAGSGVTILSRSRGMDLYYLSFGFDIYLRDAVAATWNISESKNICNVNATFNYEQWSLWNCSFIQYHHGATTIMHILHTE